MKNFLGKMFLVLLLAATPLLSQNCANTPNTGSPLALALPVAHCQQWNTQLNQNFSAINTFAGGVVLLNPTVSQTIAQAAGTSLNVNALQIYGAVPTLMFGSAPGVPTGYLTAVAPGDITFDSVTPGDSLGAISLLVANVNGGYSYKGGVGVTAGQCLVAGTDSGHLFTPQVCVNPTTVYYQTAVTGSTAVAQRGRLQFGTGFTLSDNTGLNQTQVALANSGVTAGTYANPTITVDALGRILSAVSAGGGSGSLATNGYWTFPGGLIVQWKTSATDFPNNGRIAVTETWPTPFPNGCFVVQATAKFDSTVTANAQGVNLYVNPGDCRTAVNLYGAVGSDTTADSNYHALLIAIGY